MNRLGDGVHALTGSQQTNEALQRLADFGTWLRSEAIEAGGLGPNESTDIEGRHLLDSVAFAAAWVSPPAVCWDLGSGVGLPGIPLAIVWPSTRMVLIDRSQKRIDLARRAARMIGVDIECEVRDFSRLSGTVEAIVSRAAMPALAFAPILRRLLAEDGRAAISGSGGEIPVGFETVTISGGGILDSAPRLLMMLAT
ncbi:MAG: class I SAM-dependent methyltransferase [Acidimicrobiia bacterium]|nr:class I SAM-dependent methyltransferase [Acidimicrobiia bacterium]